MKFAWRARSAVTVVAAVVGAAAILGGCSWLHFGSQDEAYDYRKAKPRQEPLEVPPDLSQLPKDDRFNFPANASAAKPANADAAKPGDATVAAVSPGATAAASPGAVAPSGEVASAAGVAPQVVTPGMVAPAGVLVAPVVVGARIMRDGDQRWLAVEASPELVYTTIKDLWTSLGYKITTDDPRFGVLETDWSETHPEINEDAIRNALHRAFGAFDANGNRHKYRALIERTAKNTSEVTITQRGMEEVFVGPLKETTKWQALPPNPELEAEMLQRLALRFAPVQPLQVAVATSAIAPAPVLASAAPALPAAPESRVHMVTAGGVVTLQVEDTQDRTWRKIGVALDRGGFTIEDRNRDKSFYTVRYLDPDYEASEREKRSWWDRMFNADAKVPEQQFRIVVSANGPNTAVEIQDKQGKPDNGATAKHILDQLVEQLR